ncbi:MAG: 2,3-diphosphoglycerate-dependent phosphoglycerate mutase [Candidatus Goldbacteria bacterium]|nr:2,3-diphosphoglycerate-dependent phosphoglycerate mutase [Candidatus Goldiibacteriota bacterium]
MYKLILLRHGESQWNKENRFTGWTDVDLSEKGVSEAHAAAGALKKAGLSFGIAFTSRLIRALKTLSIVMDDMDIKLIKIVKAWELNERHYGALQGLNKAEMAQKFGEEQVKIWRRSYDIRPPALELSDPRHPANDALYKDLDPALLPSTECLKDTVARVVPYFEKNIAPRVKSERTVIISAHGNSLRALVKYFDNIPDEEITEVNIPTGIPLIYEMDDNLKAVNHYYLGDPEEIKKAIEKVENQGKKK